MYLFALIGNSLSTTDESSALEHWSRVPYCGEDNTSFF